MSFSSPTDWRSFSSECVVSHIHENYQRFGITRIADITGLDQLEIPVCIAIRPISKTLAVSSGKGIDLSSSFISAGMEAIETHVAEYIDSSLFFNSTWLDLPHTQRLDLSLFQPYLRLSKFSDINLSWLTCISALNCKTFYLPASLICFSTDSLIEPVNIFRSGSNGLASGLSYNEAYLSSLYELIERDALQCWKYAIKYRGLKHAYIDISTIPHVSTNELIAKVVHSGLSVFILDYTTDLNVPVYRCIISGDIDSAVPLCHGFGCHHIHEIALNRAITEAVQARTVLISGSRDDYSFSTLGAIKKHFIAFVSNENQMMRESYSPVESTFVSVERSIDSIHDVFYRMSIGDSYVYNFQNTEPFCVLRTIVPGLAPLTAHGYESSVYGRGFSHPRLDSFMPKIDELRKTIFYLNPSNTTRRLD